MIYLGIHYFVASIIINIGILIYLPFLLQNYSYIFLSKPKTQTLFLILISIFVMTIINFLVISFSFKSSSPNAKKRLFIKVLAIFVMYFTLIFSVIESFAYLYTYLGNVFNEGIGGEIETISHLDAVYFSTTTFFTIGLGDLHPLEYSEISKKLVIAQGFISHTITVILWPVAIIFLFNKPKTKAPSYH